MMNVHPWDHEQRCGCARPCPPAWLASEAGRFPPPHPSVRPSPPALHVTKAGRPRLHGGCHQFPFHPQTERRSCASRVLYRERFSASFGSSCSKWSFCTFVLCRREFCIWRLKRGSSGKWEGIRTLLLTVAAYRRRKRKSALAQKMWLQLQRPYNLVSYRPSRKWNDRYQSKKKKKMKPPKKTSTHFFSVVVDTVATVWG